MATKQTTTGPAPINITSATMDDVEHVMRSVFDNLSRRSGEALALVLSVRGECVLRLRMTLDG
jgi:hypothetical protein